MFSKLQTILPFQKVYVSLLFYGILELNSVIVYQRGMKVMRLGMAQMSMSKDMDENFAKTLDFGSLTLAIKEKRCEASKMAYFFVNFSIFPLSNV